MKRELIALLSVGALWGCGAGLDANTDPSKVIPPVGSPDLYGVVVKSRSTFQINTGNSSGGGPSILSMNGSQPITAVNSPSSRMTLDNSLFQMPTISSVLLDFGYLQVTDLHDNDLKVCGNSGNQQCGTALIRMYTTGATGAGLYNSADGYGAPIQAGQTNLLTVGLGVAGSAVMQSLSIPNNKHVIHLSDFINPKYDVKIDFSNAGAGTYSTTLVVEYALAP